MTKKIPYGRQNIDDSDLEAVNSVLISDFLTQGPKVKEFEDNFANYVEAKFAVAVNNATAGLHLSVLALNLKKGDRVITTPITFAATANCIRYVGAQVWFADINPNTYLLDLSSVEELIKSKPPGFFKGIIPVDFGGLPVNMEDFRKLANKYNLWIIEDASHAPGGYYFDSNGNKNYCGNCNYADLGVFSFHPVKHIACGEGGMITTNSKKLYEKLLLLRTHGITKNNISKNHGNWYYEMKDLGFNYRITDFQSALGINQLKKNVKGLIRRNQIAEKYKKSFSSKLKFQDLPKNFYNAHHLFIIECKKRKKLYEFLHSYGILSQIHYIPIFFHPFYKKICHGKFDGANYYYNNCLSLPIFPSIKEEDLTKITNCIGKIIRRYQR